MKPLGYVFFPFSIILIVFFVASSGCSGLLSESTPYPLPTNIATPEPTATTLWFPPTATPTLFVAPTLQTTPNLLGDVGSLSLSDDFTDITAWQVGEKSGGSAEYSTNRLTLAVQQPQGNTYSFRSSPILQNAYVEITTSISLCQGNDSYGLLFRSSSVLNFYRFSINCNGLMQLERVRENVANILVNWSISSQISAGAPLTLRLGVWMNGTTFRVFINNAFQFLHPHSLFNFKIVVPFLVELHSSLNDKAVESDTTESRSAPFACII